MQWYAPASGKRGRQPIFGDAAIEFCLSIECLFGLALRQSLGLVQGLLRLAGMDWRVPDFSTLSRRQKTLQVRLPYRRSSTALDLLVDSTGIKFLGEGECKRKKHGAEYRRQWRKVHLGIDAKTLEIRAIEVTDTAAQERQAVERDSDGSGGAQRSPAGLPEAGGEPLQEVQRLPPKKPGGDQDALLQAPGRAGNGTHVRASGHRSCTCGWRCSTASRNWGARPRWLCLPWRSCVWGWGWGSLGLFRACATKPVYAANHFD
ncbi:hypothetical protein AVHM3334_03225 [Acidovorax sp. SUPP3334]|nr:hypothetical protein AVHM3334_03225 [Acidovorax sp. SUPP3334]